jgi:hypothetical protein
MDRMRRKRCRVDGMSSRGGRFISINGWMSAYVKGSPKRFSTSLKRRVTLLV